MFIPIMGKKYQKTIKQLPGHPGSCLYAHLTLKVSAEKASARLASSSTSLLASEDVLEFLATMSMRILFS